MADKQTHSCPRRAEAPYRLPGDDGTDTWQDRPGLGGATAPGRSCSYCGSLHPDTFMQLAEEGWWVGPTDQPSKAYLQPPVDGDGKPTGSAEAKFYFQHLSEDQRGRFVQLLNERKMRIGYPGRFYVLPFFVQVQDPQ